MPVTIKEIARKAGVDHSTVSRVLNNKTSYAGKTTREKILQVARELDYKRNYLASYLKKGKTNLIGFLGENIARNRACILVNNLVAAGIEENLPEERSLITFPSRGETGIKRSLDLVRQGIVDGLVIQIFPYHYDRLTSLVIPALEQTGVPFVVVHPTGQKLPCPYVGVDREQGGYLAGRHLLSLGYGDIAVFVPWPDRPGSFETRDGVGRAFTEAGKSSHDVRAIIPDPPRPGEGINASAPRALKNLTSIPRALIFPSQHITELAKEVFIGRGLRIPEDVALIGYGDINFVDAGDSGITSIEDPLEEQGRVANRILLALLDRVAGTEQQVRVIPKLTVKQSCGGK